MTIIATWNINSVRIRLELINKFITEVNPDILLFQEIKCTNDDFPDFFSKLGYRAIINGQKGKYGTAILLKNKIEYDIIEIKADIIKKESRTNFIYVKELDLNILNVYTPNGNPIENSEKFNFKISWLREIIKLSSNLITCNKNLLIADCQYV